MQVFVVATQPLLHRQIVSRRRRLRVLQDQLRGRAEDHSRHRLDRPLCRRVVEPELVDGAVFVEHDPHRQVTAGRVNLDEILAQRHFTGLVDHGIDQIAGSGREGFKPRSVEERSCFQFVGSLMDDVCRRDTLEQSIE